MTKKEFSAEFNLSVLAWEFADRLSDKEIKDFIKSILTTRTNGPELFEEIKRMKGI